MLPTRNALGAGGSWHWGGGWHVGCGWHWSGRLHSQNPSTQSTPPGPVSSTVCVCMQRQLCKVHRYRPCTVSMHQLALQCQAGRVQWEPERAMPGREQGRPLRVGTPGGLSQGLPGWWEGLGWLPGQGPAQGVI